VLLRQVGTIRQRDLNNAWFDATQLSADESHYRLFGETLFDFFREGGVSGLMRHEQV
jgi:hypothetical protein